MKKLIIILSVLLMMFAVVVPCVPVYAGEVSQSEVTTYTEVKISATVPEGFNEDIIITLEESITLIRGGVVLNAENGYSSSTNVLGGNIYNTYVRYGNNGDWKCDIAKQYEVPNGVSVEFSITVTDGSIANNVLAEEQPEQSQPVSGTTETPHSEDIDPLTNLLKGEVAVQNFINKVSFVQYDATYQGTNFLSLYSSASKKKLYLKSNSINTEEAWEKMTEFERFVWMKCFYEPSNYLYKNAGMIGANYSIDDFLEDAICVEKNMFDTLTYTDENIVYDALVELCEWHYSYFLVTGTVYDYYNGAEYVLDEEAQEVVIIEEVKQPEEIKQIEELKEEVMAELTDEEKEELGIEEEKEPNKILQLLKGNIITILLLVVVGIALLVIKRKKRNSGIYDETGK